MSGVVNVGVVNVAQSLSPFLPLSPTPPLSYTQLHFSTFHTGFKLFWDCQQNRERMERGSLAKGAGEIFTIYTEESLVELVFSLPFFDTSPFPYRAKKPGNSGPPMRAKVEMVLFTVL